MENSLKPVFNMGDKFYNRIADVEQIVEIEYVSNLPLGTEYTNEHMYLAKVYKTDKLAKRSFYYHLFQERDLCGAFEKID